MKKIFCLTFILLSAVGIFAQEKTIEKSVFDAALKNRFLKYSGQYYRQTTRSESITPDPGSSKITSKSVTEFAKPLAATRLFYEFDSRTIKSKMETVIIDGKIYSRKDDGEWTTKEFAIEREKLPEQREKFDVVELQTEYKWIGTEILNKLNTSVYAKIEKKKQVNETNKNEMFSTIVTKYWLDQDGGIVQEESLMENQIKLPGRPLSGIYRHRRTTVWEFDPSIKIEAPVLVR